MIASDEIKLSTIFTVNCLDASEVLLNRAELSFSLKYTQIAIKTYKSYSDRPKICFENSCFSTGG